MDAQLRVQYQHEYTLAGRKALILINGGAIIALLTYAGHTNSIAMNDLESALALYAAGLALGVLAYVAAYLSQAQLMNHSTLEAQRMLGLSSPGGRTSASYVKAGTWAVYFGIIFAVLSLASFAAGSLFASRR